MAEGCGRVRGFVGEIMTLDDKEKGVVRQIKISDENMGNRVFRPVKLMLCQ